MPCIHSQQAPNGHWYKMDDTVVTHQDVSYVLEREAYILFYSKVDIRQQKASLTNGSIAPILSSGSLGTSRGRASVVAANSETIGASLREVAEGTVAKATNDIIDTTPASEPVVPSRGMASIFAAGSVTAAGSVGAAVTGRTPSARIIIRNLHLIPQCLPSATGTACVTAFIQRTAACKSQQAHLAVRNVAVDGNRRSKLQQLWGLGSTTIMRGKIELIW
jgi:hypothetical protein